MIKKIILLIVLWIMSKSIVSAGQYNLKGRVTDSLQVALPGVSVALLDPRDSTLVGFSITNEQGIYTLTAIREGSYLMQMALMGYYTNYTALAVNETMEKDLGVQVLSLNGRGTELDAVIVSGEKIPIRLKGDTLEYNAGSFKVKPDAVVEDLLKKMPGMQVDKNGNIQSMGKTVTKVLVDGKEFFGDDPKVATRNLPADAVDKIHSFEKKSDASLFSGIDDGAREQTLNVVLKDGKKTGYFGEAKAGGGIPGKYEGLLKAFKFRQKSQLATMGMFNNINKFGFSFEDYFNFNGGLSALAGGEIRLDSDEMPVDLGQPVPGEVHSGALTLNYMLEPDKRNRFTINYMGNGMDKFLDQRTNSKNFIPGGSFETGQQEQNKSNNLVNRASVKWRRQADATFMTANVYGLLKNNKENSQSLAQNYRSNMPENYLDNSGHLSGNKTELAGDFSWMKKQQGKWPVLKAVLHGRYKYLNGAEQWRNRTVFDNPFAEMNDAQYRNEQGHNSDASAHLSAVRTLGKGYFLEPSLKAAVATESINRKQGQLEMPQIITDSLSPSFAQEVMSLSTELAIKRIQKKQRWELTLKRSDVWLSPTMKEQTLNNRHYAYFLPAAFWERDFKAGTRVRLSYNTKITTPNTTQLLPVTDYRNPLMLTRGNPNLVPEYNHTANALYTSFDQFNMATFAASLRGSYTKDNIGYSRSITADLAQQLEFVNTPYEWSGQLDLSYSRPVKRIGLNIDVRINERWTQSIHPVNQVNNRNNTLSHTLDLSFSKIKSDVLDLRWGGVLNFSDSRYSINKEMNNQYNNYSGFVQLGYRPHVNWNMSVSGDITHYTARSFDQSLTIPLLHAELSRYIFANQRGAISLKAFDLLDKNKAIQRSSQLNYLMERSSNTIGRYVMLSLSYRLNKAGNTPGSIKLQR